MKRLIFLTLLTIPEILGQYLRDGKDPFLIGWDCKTAKGQKRVVEDPQFCDRVLLCGNSAEKAIVQYCPEGQVFVPRRGCRPLLSGMAYCKRKGLIHETPRKINHNCSPNFNPGNRTDVIMNAQNYFEKISDIQFAACPKRKTKAIIFECHDPAFPELVMDTPDLFKCRPSGFSQAEKITKVFQVQESHFKPKKEVFAAKGLPIQFRDDRPVCPTNKIMTRRFGFDHTTRFPDNSDCLTFWTCTSKHEPESFSCPKAFQQVFHPRLQKCVHYKDAGVEEPCNTFYDQDSKLDKSYAKSELTQGQYIAEITHLLRIAHDLRVTNVEQYLFVKEELTNFYEIHGPKFHTADGIIRALKNLGIVSETEESEFGTSKTRETRSTQNDGIPKLVWENGVPKCPQPPFLYPELANVAEIKKKVQDGLLNPKMVYKTEFYLFGSFNMMEDPEDCGKFYRCDAVDAYNEDFRPKLIECFNNFIFNPIQMQWGSLIKPNTGRCVDPKKIKVKGCDDWVSKGNPLTTLVDETESAQYKPILSELDALLGSERLLQKYGLMAYDDYEEGVEALELEPSMLEDPLKTLDSIIDETSKVVQTTTITTPRPIPPTTTSTKLYSALTQNIAEIEQQRALESVEENEQFQHFRSVEKREAGYIQRSIQSVFDRLCMLITPQIIRHMDATYEFLIFGKYN